MPLFIRGWFLLHLTIPLFLSSSCTFACLVRDVNFFNSTTHNTSEYTFHITWHTFNAINSTRLLRALDRWHFMGGKTYNASLGFFTIFSTIFSAVTIAGVPYVLSLIFEPRTILYSLGSVLHCQNQRKLFL